MTITHTTPDDTIAPDRRGFTLVELMVVVAIIAILAALAIGAYQSQIDKGRITKMKELAMEVEKGQKQYASRNGRYFAPNTTIYTAGDDEWEQLLEFQHDSLHPDTRVMTTIGGSGDPCAFCDEYTPPNGADDPNWYAIQVCRDLDGTTNGGTDCTADTTVYLDNSLDQPAVLREGE